QQARAERLSRRLRQRPERAALHAQGQGVTMERNGALAGLRVVDLTRVLAGPLCTMMLGDMGADVIKVEPPGSGDDTRTWGPPFAEKESAYFLGINRKKRSVTLNLSVKPAQATLAKIVAQCDAIVAILQS